MHGRRRCKSCYFLAYGLIEVEGTNISEPILISPGQILGEFALWIPDTRRTANLKAAEDCLVLEVSTALFQSIMDDYPNLAKGIYGTIQHRILENMSNSAELFPISAPSSVKISQRNLRVVRNILRERN